MSKKIAVIGGGSFGTSFAILLAGKGYNVRLWVYEEDLAAEMKETRINRLYLPGSCLMILIPIGHLLFSISEYPPHCYRRRCHILGQILRQPPALLRNLTLFDMRYKTINNN